MPLTPEEMDEMVKALQKLCEESQALEQHIRKAMAESSRAERQMQTPLSDGRKKPRNSR
jgi:hypothetical protein